MSYDSAARMNAKIHVSSWGRLAIGSLLTYMIKTRRLWTVNNGHHMTMDSQQWTLKINMQSAMVVKEPWVFSNGHEMMVYSQQWSSTGNGSQQWSSKNYGLSSMFIKYLRTVWFCNDHLRTMDSQQWSSKDGEPSPIVIKYGVQSVMIISNDEQSTMVVKGRQTIINEQQRTTDSQQLLS